MTTRLVLCFLFFLCSSLFIHGSDLVALTNGRVIDPGLGTVRPGMTILIKGERIHAVFPDGQRPLPEETVTHDLGGRFVIPGLIESHTHLSPLIARSPGALDRELERMLAGGIVALRDMAGNARAIDAVRQRIDRGEQPGPDIFFSAVLAGPHFMATDVRVGRTAGEFRRGEAPWAQTVTSETDIAGAVSRARETGATALKLYVEIDGDRIRALTAEAHRQGLEVWAHATVYPARPIEVVRAGVDAVSHLCSLVWQDADLDPGAQTKISIQNRPRFDPALVEADSPEMTALFAEMVQRDTTLDATLTNHLRDGDDAVGCISPLMIALAKAAHRAGVRIAAGTDYNAPADDRFPSLHREIEALVNHGVLTPAEALAAATINGAQALGKPGDYGAIEPSRLASLVVLAENPLESVRALRSVVMVIKRGSVIPLQQTVERIGALTSTGVTRPGLLP